MNLLQKIVTPNFITFNAHCWFAYALLATFHPFWLPGAIIAGAAIKEFYIDKHYEVGQTFEDNFRDWLGYVAGVVLAHVFL